MNWGRATETGRGVHVAVSRSRNDDAAADRPRDLIDRGANACTPAPNGSSSGTWPSRQHPRCSAESYGQEAGFAIAPTEFQSVRVTLVPFARTYRTGSIEPYGTSNSVPEPFKT
jgi:hypothetical protein